MDGRDVERISFFTSHIFWPGCKYSPHPMTPGFEILAVISAGDGQTKWVEVRVRIDSGFDFDSKKDADLLLRSLRSASALIFEGKE